MNVLSLFDGISCARVALDRVGIPIKTYYASEIDKHAIQVSTKNYPEIVRLGDVREIQSLPESIDLLVGGSPCQDLSIAKKDRKGLEGERSSLFWEYKRILDLVKPTYFLLENVASMPKADRSIITKELGVEPILIDASLVSAQSRKRLFWTNIPGITQPADRGILLKDILQPDAEVDESMTVNGKSFCLTASYHKTGEGQNEYDHNKQTKQRTMVKVGHLGSDAQATRVYDPEGKSSTLSANGGGLGAKTGLYLTKRQEANLRDLNEKAYCLTSTNYKGSQANGTTLVKVGRDIGRRLNAEGHREDDNKDIPTQRRIEVRDDDKCGTITSVQKDNLVVAPHRIRKLTPIECERLQGLPDNYTEGVAKTHRYKCLGNAFNVDVVAHIFSQGKICSSATFLSL